MRVTVDRAACYGSAECAFRAPAVFAFEDGYGVVLPGKEGAVDEPGVREAAERCPSQAIVFTE
ncbi:ferredoxin [Streptomyces sp. NPDC048106]|uniref:ferredoxin n=1 Tax=Streptomyces sp. NPDC048106 TaxID=3155750 RepID=UPI003455CF1D